jgi:aminopeptidase N
MKSNEIFLKDYKKPEFTIHSIDLGVQIFDEKTVVTSTMNVEHKQNENIDLQLHGDELTFVSLRVNGQNHSYQLNKEGICIESLPNQSEIVIENEINPKTNLSLEGFYQSGDILCTQCEAEGFRRITYYLDRPDVMSQFSTRIEADKNLYPILLSNGNLIDSGDPHKKPAYLFAMVAGDLAKVTDQFVTRSNRTVDIEFFVQHGNESKTEHAINSLKASMKWDEDTFGLEYDLDIYMVVAVDSFNAGAMENKGLNIFNSQYVLADPETATDLDFLNVEGVIAHEYFHNWTGNRVTCRDWFQLTLKEGLTVYRDQEFSADMNSRPVQRMMDVRILKEHQYPEDSGPTSHPIRPVKYAEINNFYTTTVYNKGAEVIRMIEMLIGKENFRKGIDIYFKNFDGQAVTTEDFVWSMEQASNRDLSQFKRWYRQSGTPILDIQMKQAGEKTELHVKQSYNEKTDVHQNEPFHIPVDLGFIDPNGNEVDDLNQMLEITKDEEVFSFNVKNAIPSILRRFSAPVKINFNYSDDDLQHLAKFDTDQFNRNEAVQRYFRNKLLNAFDGREELPFEEMIDFTRFIINDSSIDSSLKAEMLTLPGVSELIEECDVADYHKMIELRKSLSYAISNSIYDDIENSYLKLIQSQSKYEIDPLSIANRKLQNVYLSYLAENSLKHAKSQYKNANNMTDSIAAFQLICDSDDSDRKDYIDSFALKWKDDFLVMNKWMIAQSSADHDDVLSHVKSIISSEYYDAKNPNNIRSVLRGFGRNYEYFHTAESYAFITDQILEIDQFNSRIAANISLAFRKYQNLPDHLKNNLKPHLNRILSTPKISKDVAENIDRILNG